MIIFEMFASWNVPMFSDTRNNSMNVVHVNREPFMKYAFNAISERCLVFRAH